MVPKNRVVMQLPLSELWDAEGIVSKSRVRALDTEAIVHLLRMHRVHFVVADPGLPLKWVPLDQCYDFWKSEVKHRIVEPDEGFRPEDYPGEYCYLASEWNTTCDEPAIVLEKMH